MDGVARLDPDDAHIVAKAEYLHNQEYAGINEFLNDVFTSSLVLAF